MTDLSKMPFSVSGPYTVPRLNLRALGPGDQCEIEETFGPYYRVRVHPAQGVVCLVRRDWWRFWFRRFVQLERLPGEHIDSLLRRLTARMWWAL